MLDLSIIQPAEGAGRLTPEQLQTPAWRYFGNRVLLGAGLLGMTAGGENMHPADWRRIILGKSETLDMSSSVDCILGILHGGWFTGCAKLGIPKWIAAESKEAHLLGFTTCGMDYGCNPAQCCDQAAAAYAIDPATPAEYRNPFAGLKEAWLMYVSATAELY